MRIGILTFHSQLNYGGVLQCWALQTALVKLGHEVVVIDRWQDVDNFLLERGYGKYGIKGWIKFMVRSCLGLGDYSLWLRVRRTKKFIKEHLHLTPYHFVNWKDAPTELGVDMLVVGSDQIWHCGDWNDPRVYLLEGAPDIPAVSYAASFGLTNLPEFLSESKRNELAEPVYKRGLAKFKAISCREREGVELCRCLGFSAKHVVDPTQLLDMSDWMNGLGLTNICDKHKSLVCYLLGEDVNRLLPQLDSFARKEHCVVKVLLDSTFALPFPASIDRAKRYLNGVRTRLAHNIKILDGVGPREFVGEFANADWVVSDSFHALMFSIAFNKNVRMLYPKTVFRRKMFARIEELTSHMKGEVVADDISAALGSFMRGERVAIDSEWIASRRNDSLDYLKANI